MHTYPYPGMHFLNFDQTFVFLHSLTKEHKLTELSRFVMNHRSASFVGTISVFTLNADNLGFQRSNFTFDAFAASKSNIVSMLVVCSAPSCGG